MAYSIQIEALALFINIVLSYFHYDWRGGNKGPLYRVFRVCLYISSLTMLCNIAACLCLLPQDVPAPLCYGLNLAYFILQYTSIAISFFYLYDRMFMRVGDKRVYRVCMAGCGLLWLLVVAIALSNPMTGALFTLEGGVYTRGPLNGVGFLYLGIELVSAVLAYTYCSLVVSAAMGRMMRVYPLALLGMCVMQMHVPDVVMSGMMSAITNLVFFITFQSSRMGIDMLTGLPYRYRFFFDLSRPRKHPRHLIFVSVDRLYELNYKYGQDVGNELLLAVAHELDTFGPRYRAYRVSSARFVLVGIYEDDEHAVQMAEQVLARLCQPWTVRGASYTIPGSVAHMVLQPEESDVNRAASQLLYTMKHARDTWSETPLYFDKTMRARFEREERVLDRMRRAIETADFELYYQPVFDVRDRMYHSAEALLRLRDDDGQMIMPGEFIPLAEANGLIDDITWIVLKLVCRFFGTHPDLPLGTISLNMTGPQVVDPECVQRMHAYCAEYGVSPARLRIEITERTLIEDVQRVYEVMTQLAQEQVHFYLDDMGTGYSNLAIVMGLPFEVVKLDASLLRHIETDSKSLSMVRLLSEMLHMEGFVIVAEGIEHDRQALLARDVGVDRIQGFFYARPMPEDAFVSFIEAQNALPVEG